jgi:DNA-binding transcriptional MerR regulator/methylmalonyl-CoA mutase cobalamin-binding subunit
MNEQATGFFPIRTVSDITGVNSITLRAWERRYGLIKPHRTAKGHRLYTQEDIELIQQILELIDEGIPISRVRMVVQQTQATNTTDEVDIWETHINAIIQAISEFNELGIERIYNEVLSIYPVDVVTRQLILPLLRVLGERWAAQKGSIAEEHFFGVFLRNKLGARFHHRQQHNSGPKLVAACLPNEQHEIGLLLFALAAHERGFQIILLGGNMPIEELPTVAKKTRADAVVLSGSMPINDKETFSKIQQLVTDTGLPVFVGGRAASTYKSELLRIKAIPAGDELVDGLKLIRNTLIKFQQQS